MRRQTAAANSSTVSITTAPMPSRSCVRTLRVVMREPRDRGAVAARARFRSTQRSTAIAALVELAERASVVVVDRVPLLRRQIEMLDDLDCPAGVCRALLRIEPRVGRDCHRMTSSAWTRTDSGIVSPSVLAVLRLITSLNWVGCSMGRFSGLAPLRISSTYSAARRNATTESTP